MGFKVIESRMAKFKTPEDRDKFQKFLEDNVQLVRAILPVRTDLNKYFEIMNTRGQQLEQVDIVKARLMSYLRNEAGEVEDDRACLAWVWDACAEMDSYIQMALTPGDTDLRDDIFSPTWDRLKVSSFDDLRLKTASDSTPEVARAGVRVSSVREALRLYARTPERASRGRLRKPPIRVTDQVSEPAPSRAESSSGDGRRGRRRRPPRRQQADQTLRSRFQTALRDSTVGPD